MALGTPTYPTTLDTTDTIGPTSGIVAGVTPLNATGTNQGDQLGILNNIISRLIALETKVGVNASADSASLDYKTSSLSLISFDLANVTTNQSVDCTGARSVSGYLSVNTAFSPTLTLNNLPFGIPVVIFFRNGWTASVTIKILATGYVMRSILGVAGMVDIGSTGVSVPTLNCINAVGTSVNISSVATLALNL